jgi:hypothetical protein
MCIRIVPGVANALDPEGGLHPAEMKGVSEIQRYSGIVYQEHLVYLGGRQTRTMHNGHSRCPTHSARRKYLRTQNEARSLIDGGVGRSISTIIPSILRKSHWFAVNLDSEYRRAVLYLSDARATLDSEATRAWPAGGG